jgi:thioredoxin-like negative regulator of GroEL
VNENSIARVTDQNYASFLQVPASTVVFGIVPCQQCEDYDPIIKQAAEHFNGTVSFGKAKLHVPGACREIKRKYKFDSFPTTHFYKQGELVHKTEGMLDLPTLTQTIERVLLNPAR